MVDFSRENLYNKDKPSAQGASKAIASVVIQERVEKQYEI